MSYPVIDYLPFDYESYMHEIRLCCKKEADLSE
jgi:hypothetical protein